MSAFVLVSLLLGLQVNHTLFAENLNGDFRYCVSQLNHPNINGDTKVCLYFNKSFSEEPKVRVCVPTVCTEEFDNYYYQSESEYGSYTSLCIWFWSHQLKTMKLSFEAWMGDDVVEIRE